MKGAQKKKKKDKLKTVIHLGARAVIYVCSVFLESTIAVYSSSCQTVDAHSGEV